MVQAIIPAPITGVQVASKREGYSGGTGSVRMVDLAKFDEKIHAYLGLQAEVATLRHSQNLHFIRVNAQPIKQAIRSYIAHEATANFNEVFILGLFLYGWVHIFL